MKVDDLKEAEEKEMEEEFGYEGRLNDRVTEDEYRTENLMQVRYFFHNLILYNCKLV